MKTENKLIGAGFFTALAASLCCITPVLALVAGTGGLASTFSWLEPLRPYFIGLTILVLGYAWYQRLKPQKPMDCGCETDTRSTFMQGKTFLGIITVFTALMLTFPMYAPIFYPQTEKQSIAVDPLNRRTVEFSIEGMTCASCEEHVKHEVNQLSGIVDSKVSYEQGNASVTFDRTKTNPDEIEQAILETGYSVTAQKEQ